jgi:hypothetical protein
VRVLKSGEFLPEPRHVQEARPVVDRPPSLKHTPSFTKRAAAEATQEVLRGKLREWAMTQGNKVRLRGVFACRHACLPHQSVGRWQKCADCDSPFTEDSSLWVSLNQASLALGAAPSSVGLNDLRRARSCVFCAAARIALWESRWRCPRRAVLAR